MPGPDLPEIPAPLKGIQHYLKIASEHDQRDPVVSYWARLYALQTGLKLSTKTTAENNFLLKLMDWLESTKKSLIDNEAITNDVAAQAHLENWALKLFLYADKNDRESNFNKSVIQSFYTAGLLYDVLTTFGELTEEAVQNRKYAKWKAAYIHNCLKNGETPVPGPIKEEGEEDEDNSNVDLGPEEDLLADITADSEPAGADEGKDQGQADAVTPNELDTDGSETAQEAPSEPGIDSAEEAPNEPETDDPESAQEAPSEPGVEPAEEAPNDPETDDPESAHEALSELGIDPAEEAPNEPDTDDPESAQEAPSEPDIDPAEEAPSEPEAETADSQPAEVNDGKDEGQADSVTPNEPDTATPESAEEAPSEPEVDPAEEAPSEPEVDQAEEAPSEPEVDPAEEAPSEPEVDPAEEAPYEPEVDPAPAEQDIEAPGMQQPTPPPSTDAFGFPAVPSGSNTSTGSSQGPGNTPYPTLPTPITPNPYNPAPTPTSPSGPKDFTATPKPAGGVTLSAEQMIKAQKYIKWAGSAINYDDVATAIGNLQKALHLLTTGEDF